MCRCLQAYDGADCSEDHHVACPNHCSGHGRCSDHGLCYCMHEYHAPDCSQFLRYRGDRGREGGRGREGERGRGTPV